MTAISGSAAKEHGNTKAGAYVVHGPDEQMMSVDYNMHSHTQNSACQVPEMLEVIDY